MKTIRVLHVFSSLDRGGAETMVMNLYRNIDRNKIQFDFLVNGSNKKYSYEDEIKSLGGNIYRIPKYKFYNHFRFKKTWKGIIKTGNIDIVHAHSLFPAWIYMRLVKKENIKIISHIHNQKGLYNVFKEQLFTYNKVKFYKFVDIALSCSVEASKYAYGKHQNNAIIFNNSLDIEKFLYHDDNRKKIRDEFNVDDNVVVLGHVGRFSDVKNHRFLIDILPKLIKKNSNIKLMLVGDGELINETKALVAEQRLKDHVIFTGIRDDINKIMSAFDVFLFPSKTEGFPMVLLEAQVSGLKIIATENVDQNINLSKSISFISIKDKDSWINKILEEKNSQSRDINLNDFSEYDAKIIVKNLEGIYNNLSKGR